MYSITIFNLYLLQKKKSNAVYLYRPWGPFFVRGLLCYLDFTVDDLIWSRIVRFFEAHPSVAHVI